MSEGITKVERILNLLAILLAAREPVPLQVIRETVTGYKEDTSDSEAAFVKRFQRDADELRRVGVPIEHVVRSSSGEGGYRVRRQGYYLPRLRLDPMESLLLDQLAATLEGDPGGRYPRALRAAIRKLHFDRPGPEEDPAHGVRQAALPALVQPTAERDLVLVLASAIGQRQRVRLRYYSIARDVEGEREVEPLGLRFVGGRWYLVGLDKGSGGIRTFRLSRIQGDPQVLPKVGAFRVPAEFDLDDHVPRAPWGFGLSGPDVMVACDPEVEWMVRRELGDPAQAHATGDPVRFPAANVPALTRYLSRYLDHVEVLEPPEARGAMRELAAAARARYEDNPESDGA